MIILSKPIIFKDIIHNSIEITLIAKSIIDTKIFQRLRNLHQLGVCYMVLPNANNNRFEHSIGTYHLSGLLLNSLIKNSKYNEINDSLMQVKFTKNYLLKNFELDDNEENIQFIKKINTVLLDDYLIELIKIAGLVHDLGHGPFSHLFDEWLHTKKELQNNKLRDHETRSILLLNEIVSNTIILHENEKYFMNEFINDEAFEFIAELINPSAETPTNFIFQIISNKLNGLDVDKLDYLYRDSFYLGSGTPFDLSRIISHVKVINNNICFPEKINYDIYKIYRSRYDLHKQFYNHKTSIIIEYMIRDILENLDKILNIIENLKNNKLEKFIDLVDSTILNTSTILKNIPIIYTEFKNNIDSIDLIIERIYQRKLYKCIYSGSFDIKEFHEIDEKINQIIKLYEQTNNISIDKNKIIPVKIKIGLLGGNNSHPFDNLYFYNSDQISNILQKDKISHLMSEFYQEIILYILYKN